MQIVNLLLTAVFLAGSIWLGRKVYTQRKLIEISGKFINGYRIFIMFCLVASCMTLFLGFEDIFDLIRSIAMMVMVALFLALKEGAGQIGLVYNGIFVPYDSVTHYDIKPTKKACVLYVVVREKGEDSNFSIDFNKTSEAALTDLLKEKMPKKHQRMKKF